MNEAIKNLLIKTNTTIREAMQKITNAAHLKLPVGITLVIDDKNKLIGSVTDGDIRKALVKGFDLNDTVGKIMAKDPITVSEGISNEEMISSVMQKVKDSGRIHDYKVDKVIVIDNEGKVADVIDFYELWYKQEIKYKNICIVGTGHVGLTLLVALAEVGYQLTGYDVNAELIGKLSKGEIPFYEKGLEPMLKFHLKERNVKFINSLKENYNEDVYIINVGTPVDDNTKKPFYTYIEEAAKDIAHVLKKDDIVILRSTVPVGTTRNIVKPIFEKISSLRAGEDFYLVFAPERVVEGKALEELREIPQIIGGINQKSAQFASKIFQALNPSIIILDSLEEAEIIKLINNTYRDISFSFANQIALICEKLEINAVKVIKAASDGYQRNPVPMPSPGVGGYCLTKDPFIMADVASKYDVNADLFLHARNINNEMPYFVARKVLDFLEKNYSREKKIKIFIMGFAFKGYPENSDIRGSNTLDIINILRKKLQEKAVFYGFDIIVKKEVIENLGVKYCDYINGFQDSHCVLIMNNHPDFSKIDIFEYLQTMNRPGFFFDGWNFFQPQEIKKVQGIFYQGLGGGF